MSLLTTTHSTRSACRRFFSALTTALLVSLLSYGNSTHGAPRPVRHNLKGQVTRDGSNEIRPPDVNQLIEDLTGPRLAPRAAIRALQELGDKAAPAVPHLIDLVRGEDPHLAARAAVALGKIGPVAHGAIPLIHELAFDANLDTNLRHSAIFALGEFGPAARVAIPDLLALLGDDKNRLGKISAWALGKMGPEVVPLLTKALADDDVIVSEGAALALGGLGAVSADALTEALDDDRPAVRGAAAKALAKLGPAAKPALPRLIELLRDDASYGRSSVVYGAAAYALGAMGPDAAPAVPALIELLGKYRNAAWALGKIGPAAKPAVPFLIELLHEPNYYDRIDVAEALGGIGPDAGAAVPALVELLNQGDGSGRITVAKALGQIRDATAVALLINLLQDKEPGGHSGAISALQELGPLAKPALPLLLKLVLTSDELFFPGPWSYAATRAMVQIDPDSIHSLVDALTDDPETAFHASTALGRIGKDALPAVIDALRSDDPDLCVAAIFVLHRFKADAVLAVPDLERLIGHPNESVSKGSRKFLSKLVRDDVLDESVFIGALTMSLQHPNTSVRGNAAKKLGEFGSRADSAIPDLIELLQDESSYVRAQALRALAGIGPAAAPAVPALREILRGDKIHLAGLAARALGNIGDAAKVAIPDLIEALGWENQYVRAAAEALVKFGADANDAIPALLKTRKRRKQGDGTLQSLVLLGPDGVRALAEATKSDTHEVRLHTADVLGRMGEDGVTALPILITLLQDEKASIRRRAAKSIGTIGPVAKSALPALEQAKNDEDETVRKVAKWASGVLQR